MDLAIHPEWKAKCKKEVENLLSRHFGDSPSTLYEKLNAVPFSAWEDEFPIIDACTRESHRIAFTMASVRRNLGEDINIGGGTAKWGDFLAYPMTEVHLNPDYYPEPLKYDPNRWLQPDSAPKTVYPFLGFGAGRHPCAGMKVAKLEMKWIVAMFLMRYEYELVDASGKFPKSLPVPDRNDPQVCVESRGEKSYDLTLVASLLLLSFTTSRFTPLERHITLSLKRLWNRRVVI